MGPDVARHEVHVVLLHQAVGRLLTNLGLKTIIRKNELQLRVTRFATEVLHGKVGCVLHVFTNHGAARCQRGDETDFDGGSMQRAGHCGGGQGE